MRLARSVSEYWWYIPVIKVNLDTLKHVSAYLCRIMPDFGLSALCRIYENPCYAGIAIVYAMLVL